MRVKVTECGSTEMAPRNVVARSADRWRVPHVGENGSKARVKVKVKGRVKVTECGSTVIPRGQDV